MVKSIALTGGIGSGKSEVLKMFNSLGYVTLNADQLAREAVALPAVMEQIKTAFGSDVYNENNQLNREKVRQVVFGDETKRAILESITHPAIAALFQNYKQNLENISTGAWLIYEAAIIIESKRHTEFDAVLLVTAKEEVRLERLLRFRQVENEVAKSIMKSQLHDDEKRKVSDFVIDNSGTKTELLQNVMSTVQFLQQKFQR